MKQHHQSDKDGQALYHLLESSDWAVAKAILDEKLAVLRDVSLIEGSTAQEIGEQAIGRQMAVILIETWYRDLETRRDAFLATTERQAEQDEAAKRTEQIVVNRE